MRLSKFERKKRELQKKHEEALKALLDAEQKELEKLIEPVVEKIAKVAEEEARKILEKDPDILETFNFKKRDAAKIVAEAIEAYFRSEESSEEDDEDEEEPTVQNEDPAVATADFGQELPGNF